MCVGVSFLVAGRVHAPTINVASRVDHEKTVVWFSISMHACGSLPIVIVLRLATQLRYNVLAPDLVRNAFYSRTIFSRRITGAERA